MNRLDLIFDTDVGSDCDDMMALTYLVYARRYRNVDIKAITHCHNCPNGVPAIRALFRHLGENIPPLGKMPGEQVVRNNYSRAVAERFGMEEDFAPTPDAVKVLRRALAESENAVLCAVGPFSNIAALLESDGDEISPLDGVSLVRERCAKVVVMGGSFVPSADGRPSPEWNARIDIAATQTMVRLCPVPLVFSPFELGENMLTGKPMMDQYGEKTPLSLSFICFSDTLARGGRHSWDPATAVYAVEGVGDLFEEGPRGTVTVDNEGRTILTPNPTGLHSVLRIKIHDGMSLQACKNEIAAYIDECAMNVYEECMQ